MKFVLISLLAVACSGSETPAPEVNTPAKTETTAPDAKPDAKPDQKAHSGHGDAGHADGHGAHGEGNQNAGAHVGPVPEGAKVFFVSPQDGATVTSPVKIQMGVEGMEVQPAGKIQDGSGHHHIVIDADPIAKGTLVPADEQHKHFGKGQTETELTLAPGQHTLQLQFANGVHLSYGEQMSSKITITVE